MRIFIITFIAILHAQAMNAQNGWEWEFIGSMPEPVSNNAFIEAYCGDTLCYYSFTGIGSDLTPQSIHLKSWRYNTVLSAWQTLPYVNDFRGKIAAGASSVNGIVYLIGGYYVFDNLSEQTSAKVHRFDAQANSWLEDGADLPVPVDDHVQAVWRDSLIYVVTGWSNNTNTASVQIYNPAIDEWTSATSVPPTAEFRAFGASGTIIGDTIYYFGGVHISGFSFLANKRFRKGIINPENPAEIEWEFLGDAPVENNGYRMACSSFQNEAIWFGGGGVAYNFDALAYSNNQIVQPLAEIRSFEAISGIWSTAEPSPFPIMDLRGIAREDEDSWVIAGGIANNREVSDQVWRIRRATVSTEQHFRQPARIIYHPNKIEVVTDGNLTVSHALLFNISGALIQNYDVHANRFTISTSSISAGVYVLKLLCESGGVQAFKLVINN